MDASHPKVGYLELGLTNEKNYELHPAEKSIGTAAKEFWSREKNRGKTEWLLMLFSPPAMGNMKFIKSGKVNDKKLMFA